MDAQIGGQAENILGGVKNAYDIAVRQEKSLEASLNSLTANVNSEAYAKSQQLRLAEVDRKDYETYLAQYNYIAEQREMQAASARIISPATLPRLPSTNRLKFYALGGMGGLGGGLLPPSCWRFEAWVQEQYGNRAILWHAGGGFCSFRAAAKSSYPPSSDTEQNGQ